jgi:hypothetical protein
VSERREIFLKNDCDGYYNRYYSAESPVFPNARKISRLIEAVSVLTYGVTGHAATARNDERGSGEIFFVFGNIRLSSICDSVGTPSEAFIQEISRLLLTYYLLFLQMPILRR